MVDQEKGINGRDVRLDLPRGKYDETDNLPGEVNVPVNVFRNLILLFNQLNQKDGYLERFYDIKGAPLSPEDRVGMINMLNEEYGLPSRNDFVEVARELTEVELKLRGEAVKGRIGLKSINDAAVKMIRERAAIAYKVFHLPVEDAKAKGLEEVRVVFEPMLATVKDVDAGTVDNWSATSWIMIKKSAFDEKYPFFGTVLIPN